MLDFAQISHVQASMALLLQGSIEALGNNSLRISLGFPKLSDTSSKRRGISFFPDCERLSEVDWHWLAFTCAKCETC